MPPRTFGAVIYLLGAALLLSITGITALAILGQPSPEILGQVVIGAPTGLAGILAAQRGTTTHYEAAASIGRPRPSLSEEEPASTTRAPKPPLPDPTSRGPPRHRLGGLFVVPAEEVTTGW